jgi:hypothetical protein
VEDNQQAKKDYFGFMSYFSRTGKYATIGNQKVLEGLKNSLSQIAISIY